MKQPSMREVKKILVAAGLNPKSIWGYNDVRLMGRLASVGAKIAPDELLRRFKVFPINISPAIGRALKEELSKQFEDLRFEVNTGYDTLIHVYSK